MTVLVGSVAELYQGDLDAGRAVVERLVARGPLSGDVLVEDLSYGGVAVAQRLQELAPEALVLVGAERRGREPGTVERRVPVDLPTEVDEIQRAIGDAVTGYVGIELLLTVANGLEALPPIVVTVEIEPVTTEPSVELSLRGDAAVDEAVSLVLAELDVLAASAAAPGG